MRPTAALFIAVCLTVTTACGTPAPALHPGDGMAAAPGGRIWYRVVGEGRGVPLLVIHGGPRCPCWSDAAKDVLLYEFKEGLNAYLATATTAQKSLAALMAWNSANAAEAMPFSGQELFEQAQAKGPLTDAAYVKAKAAARTLAGRDGLVAALDGQKLDALIAPTVWPTWPTDHVLGDHFLPGASVGFSMAAVAGTPSLTVPMGETRGLPLGLAFMGRAYDEADLLAMGYAFEQKTKARKAPGYTPTLEP